MKDMKFERFPADDDEEDPCPQNTAGNGNPYTPSTTTALSNTDTPSPGFSANNCGDRTREKLENLWNLATPKKLGIIAVVFFFLLAGFVLLLAFIVRCDESKLIGHYEERKLSIEKAFTEFSALWEARIQEREENYKAKKIEWLPKTRFTDDQFEPAGNERFGTGNLLLYVARTSYRNGTVVGKYCPYLRTMYFGYGGTELVNSDFEILAYPSGSLSWLPRKKADGLPSENSLVLGGIAPATGENTYICRLEKDGHLIIGKILPSSAGCVAAYKNKEFTLDTFEILVINAMGRMLGVDA